MSNVYKYYVPQEKTDETRHINNNAASEERIKRFAEAEARAREEALRQAEAEAAAEDGEAGEEGEFAEGILADQVDPDGENVVGEEREAVPEAAPAPEPSGPPPEVMQQIEALVDRASQEAEQILSNARAEAEELKKAACAKGHDEGLQSGRAAAEKEVAARMQEIEALKKSMQAERDQALKELEPKLLDVILQVFERVFHIQFGEKKEILEYLIINTIMNVEGSKEFRIKTSESNLDYLNAHLPEIRSQVGQEYLLEVISDSSLSPSQCVIETDAGLFDCSIDVHLENLIKDLKSLCP